MLGPDIKRFNLEFQVFKNKDQSDVELDDFAILAINRFRVKWKVPEYRVRKENQESKYPFNPNTIKLEDAAEFYLKKFAKKKEPKNRNYKRIMATNLLYRKCFEVMN